MQFAEFQILGRIGKITSNDSVTHIDVASNMPRKQGDQWVEDTAWNRLTCFAKTKERADGLDKGDLIFVRGKMRQSSYDKDGVTIYTVDMIVDRLGVVVAGT